MKNNAREYKVATYTKEEQRSLGAFYTPLILADLIARLLEPLCPASKDSTLCVMDPAMGDGVLLQSFAKVAQKRKRTYHLVGVDIDNKAIDRSTRIFEKDKEKCVFINIVKNNCRKRLKINNLSLMSIFQSFFIINH